MRTTTIPSMMEALSRNYSRNNEIVRLFEVGKVYVKNIDIKKIPDEKNKITIGLYGNADYLDLKGIVENVFEALKIEGLSFERETENPSFHPGKTAKVCFKNICYGILGEIHPDVAENYDLDVPCYIAELDLDLLLQNAVTGAKYKSLPKFPAVTRDMAFTISEDVLVGKIEEIIKKQGGGIVENFKLFDIYKGNQIEKGKKSVAYSITYRAENRTLTDKEVEKIHNKILSTLSHVLGAELR